MSPASYLTAPPRVAASIVAPALPWSHGILAPTGVSAGRLDRLAGLRRVPWLEPLAHVQAHVAAPRRRARARNGEGRARRAARDLADQQHGAARGCDRAPAG